MTLSFFPHQAPRDLLQGLMISFLIVSGVKWMVVSILITPALTIFDKIKFQIFRKLFMFQVLWIFMRQWNYLKLEIGILDSLLRQ